jgi:acyl-CoA thioesterase I
MIGINNTVKKISIFGDSNSIPRSEYGVELITEKDTYGYKISDNFKCAEIINYGSASNRSDKVDKFIGKNNIKPDDFDLIILNIGICDCAPRLFSKIESKILQYLPNRIRGFVIRAAKSNSLFLTRYIPKYYVSKNNFEKNINNILSKFNSGLVVIVGISNVSDELAGSRCNYRSQIKSYNNILYKRAIYKGQYFIDMYNNDNSYLLHDGLHISIKAHDYIYHEIENILKEKKYG